MKPSRMLKEEHHHVGRAMKLMRQEADLLDAGLQADPSGINALVYFLREFVDRCHHAKEETVLFPAVEQKGGDLGRDISRALTADHRAGRDLVASISKLNEGYGQGDLELGHNMARKMYEYIALLARHIRTENTTLSEMLDSLFDDRESEELYERSEVIEAESPKSHHELLDILHRLEGKEAA
ncbi:MAG: hemerythrin domain-containing protein [Candidatus Aquicultorales bacterium]